MTDGTTTPDAAVVMALAAKHIHRYSGRLIRALEGAPGYRLDECASLLAAWCSIIRKRGVWADLTSEERSEAVDALADEGAL